MLSHWQTVLKIQGNINAEDDVFLLIGWSVFMLIIFLKNTGEKPAREKTNIQVFLTEHISSCTLEV